MTMNGTVEQRVKSSSISVPVVRLLSRFIDNDVILAPLSEFVHESHDLREMAPIAVSCTQHQRCAFL
jgi:hypothetical protein